MPKNMTDPMMIQVPPINFARPDIGESAMPAVDNAAIPQYIASPSDRIGLSAAPRSAMNRAAEKTSHRTPSAPASCRNRVLSTISFMNF